MGIAVLDALVCVRRANSVRMPSSGLWKTYNDDSETEYCYVTCTMVIYHRIDKGSVIAEGAIKAASGINLAR